MRGKDDSHMSASAVQGITPAYAGKSPSKTPTEGGSKDHPRVCGEKFRLTLLA